VERSFLRLLQAMQQSSRPDAITLTRSIVRPNMATRIFMPKSWLTALRWTLITPR
jgi:hypothetical protein